MSFFYFFADEEETDSDLLDEESGRDAGTRLLMAVDRLRDLRQIIDDERKQTKKLKELNHSLGSDKKVSPSIASFLITFSILCCHF